MLDATLACYASKSQAFLAGRSVGEYVAQAEAWLVDEEKRNKVWFEKDWERVRPLVPCSFGARAPDLTCSSLSFCSYRSTESAKTSSSARSLTTSRRRPAG